MTHSKPRFTPLINSSNDIPSELATEPFTPFYTSEIFGFIEELRKLTELKKAIDGSNVTTIEELMGFDAQRNALEERLLSRQYTLSTPNGLGFRDIFLDACCIAASIYMCLTFRNFTPNFPNLRTSKENLMATILKAEALFASLPSLPATDLPYAEKLLWVLSIGGSLALDEAETTWFSNRLTMVVPWTQVRSWEEAEACLQSVLWVDKLRNAACISIWNEVEGILGFKSGKLQAMEDDFMDLSPS